MMNGIAAMRRIALLFSLILGLANSAGCAIVPNALLTMLAGKHYTEGTTQEDRQSRFRRRYDEQMRMAESYQNESFAGANR